MNPKLLATSVITCVILYLTYYHIIDFITVKTTLTTPTAGPTTTASATTTEAPTTTGNNQARDKNRYGQW